MGAVFSVLTLVLLSGASLLTLSYVVNLEEQRVKVPVRVEKRRD
ncbi:hypothetical protein M2139_002545 [Enterococcus sp. PF1-24]|nr:MULTISPECIES: hypothetical protein [unclassified Enterococcus]MDH6365539.1 hypothetical protein [Enterococcus sp. PFB1-1]MDH6402640.1 hypothetical protein [Enterococcus sp. PF1-24]